VDGSKYGRKGSQKPYIGANAVVMRDAPDDSIVGRASARQVQKNRVSLIHLNGYSFDARVMNLE
jgi:serine acetyltransferase